MKIAVIIPFYQRDAGLLTKSLNSVFEQDLPADVELRVYVVDDESPVLAATEVDTLPALDQARVSLMRQANGGPGAARNLALGQVALDGADYVAFLDSDDIWLSQHLRDAVNALELGFDYYFCDHTRFNTATTYSSSIGSLVEIRNEQKENHLVIDANGPILAVDTDVVKLAMLEDYLSQTSTVVVRQSSVRTLRFLSELRGAGEDHFFWIALLCDRPPTVISWRVNVHCGRGLNLYHSAFDFGSVQSTNRIGYLLLFRQKCLEFPLDDRCRSIVEKSVARYRRAYSYMFIRAWLVGQRPDMGLFRALCRKIPTLPLAMPFRFLAVLPRRETESKDW